MNVWQVSARSTARSYAETFLSYGVALVGPGDAGRWSVDRGDAEFDGPHVRRFATDALVGDTILLRTGLARISAIGLIASEYLYLEQFDDVNGWDLQHARRIRWFRLPSDYEFSAPVFGAGPPRFSRVASADVLGYVERFLASPPTDWQAAALPPMAAEQPPLSVVPGPIQDIVIQALDLAPIIRSATGFGDPPSEDEQLTHLVVPLLRALGWPPERVAVKWRCIDVALFIALPRCPANCRFVVEAKRPAIGVEGALAQARGYVEAIGAPADIVLTDGLRFRAYSAAASYAPVAYANLLRLKQGSERLFEFLKHP